MERSIEETAGKMDALGLWERVSRCNWAVRPKGTVFPYFCTAICGDGSPVKARFLMIEGWQTFHDFVRTRVDPGYGIYSSPVEFARFELVLLSDGSSRLFRHDPCYIPREVDDEQGRAFCSKIMWEGYGVMMRIESDARLPLSFAGENAMFARVEDAKGGWSDAALPIPQPQPYVERITFAKADLAKAKDLPFAQEEKLSVDFALDPSRATREKRPRCVYRLVADDASTGEKIVSDTVSPSPDGGLKAMWESVAPRLLSHLIARGRIPGEIRVSSQRLFRMLRPLCIDLPFKLSLHDPLG